jgi:hypothetical protein
MIQYIIALIENNIMMLGAVVVVPGAMVASALKQHLVNAT